MERETGSVMFDFVVIPLVLMAFGMFAFIVIDSGVKRQKIINKELDKNTSLYTNYERSVSCYNRTQGGSIWDGTQKSST